MMKSRRAGPPIRKKFETVSRELQLSGCDSLILGCTELSLIKKNTPLATGI